MLCHHKILVLIAFLVGAISLTGTCDASSPLIDVTTYGARSNDGVDDTVAIQNAWNAAKTHGARVVLPPGVYNISLRGDATAGYSAALHLSAASADVDVQPCLVGTTGTVTFLVKSFPAGALRTQEVIRIDKGSLVDDPRGLSLSNFRLIYDFGTTSLPAWTTQHDFKGVGIRILDGQDTKMLQNFEVRGFYVGLHIVGGSGISISQGKIADCNFGIHLEANQDTITLRNISLKEMRAVATNDQGLASAGYPGGKLGACLYLSDGDKAGYVFQNVAVLRASVAGYLFHGVPASVTVTGMRSEEVYAPVQIMGTSAERTLGGMFISPYIICGNTLHPAIYLDHVRGYTFVDPHFTNRGTSFAAVEMTANARENYILNPSFGLPEGSTGAFVNNGTLNVVKYPGLPELILE